MSMAEDILDLLHRHYVRDPKRPNGIFAPEIGAPDTAGARRADLIWQGVTDSAVGGHELIGHEIKVSRSDLRAELADPDKARAWMQHCDRWYLVIPHLALADGLDLPDEWGILTPPSGRCTRTMTVARPAPDLAPADRSAGVRTVAAWLHWRCLDMQAQLDRLQPSYVHVDDGGAA